MQLQNEQETIYTIDVFKTMNRKVKQELLPSDILYNCQNLRYDKTLGMLYKRPSRRKYNSTTLGTDPITSQVRYYKNSNNTKKYVIATSTLLRVGTDSAGTFANIKTGLTANQKFTFIIFKDLLYCFNGSNNNQVYDGTNNCEDMGVPVPTAPTLALVAGGTLTGAYYYKVTYMIDGYQEGSASAASSVINPSSQKVTVTIPVSANTRVTHRKIYRTRAGEGTYYFLATIANNTDVTYEDNTADGGLTLTLAPTDYGVPGIYRYPCLHKSRVFLARNNTNKSDIIFSDVRSNVAYPDVFPANNVLHIAKDDGDEITGIAEDNVGNLVVWKTNSVRIIHTDSDSPSGWSIGKPFTNFGNIAPYCLVKTPIGVIYITRYGKNKNRLMLWNGLGTKHILEELDPILDDIDKSQISNTVGHFHNGKIYISYTDTSEFPAISIDSYTKLLLHGNGTDGSTTITDSETTPKTITAVGDAQIDTAQKVFGTGSIIFDGAGAYAQTNDSDDFTFGTDDFTIDFRIKRAAQSGARENTFGQGNSGLTGAYWIGWINANNTFAFTLDDVKVVTSTGTLDTNWHHIAVVRYGNTITLYIDGTADGTVDVTGYDAGNSTGKFAVGILGEYTPIPSLFNGWIDEFRISKGIARWTSNFTPSTVEYGYGYNNKVLVINAETLSMINIDDKAIDSFSSWNSGTDVGELYAGTSNADGFCYEEETDTDASETTIEIEAQWGKLNFGEPRVKKRLRQVKIEFDRTVASGTLSHYYALDGGSETQVDIALATYASGGYYIYFFPTTAFCYYIQPRLYSNSDISALGIKRLTYIYNTEPLLPNL